MLRVRTACAPDDTAFTMLAADGEIAESVDYRGLEQRARAIAASLLREAAPGARVLLGYPPGLEFIAALFGCAYAGMVAVPCALPEAAGRASAPLRGLPHPAAPDVIATTCGVLERWVPTARGEMADAGTVWMATDELERRLDPPAEDLPDDADALAILQYTSGSTRRPRGVRIHHRHLIENLTRIDDVAATGVLGPIVSWLPPFHDMGLIGGLLYPIFRGLPAVLLSPATFLRRPIRWLDAIARHRATISVAPNFGYELCVRKIAESDRRGLDLGRWSLALCGAEPVRGETIDRFVAAFEPCGFRSDAFVPVYGLAEATLLVSGRRARRAPTVKTLEATRRIVGCGAPITGHDLVVVDPTRTRLCEPEVVGEIWVRGPTVAAGYEGDLERTAAVFDAHVAGRSGFLRTGDLGFVDAHGELFVTGRMRDTIIVRGRNHHAEDIEWTAQRAHPDIRFGGVAALSFEDGGVEQVVIAIETPHARDPVRFAATAAAIRRDVAQDHGIAVDRILAVQRGALPRTSSGKLQRAKCKALLVDQRLLALASSALPGDTSEPSTASDTLSRWLVARVAVVLDKPSDTIALDVPITSLGLDSLAAMEIQDEIAAQHGVELPVFLLLRGPTLAELAREIETRAAAAPSPTAAPSSPATDGDEHLPVSPAQRRQWGLHHALPAHLCNCTTVGRLHVAGDVETLRACLNDVVARHESLRTGFVEHEHHGVKQTIAAAAEPDLRVVDVDPAVDDVDAAMLAVVREQSLVPFNLERAPLLRACLVRAPGHGDLLALTYHHIVADGWSARLLLHEIATSHEARERGLSVDRTPTQPRHRDVICGELKFLRAEAPRLGEYWSERLADLPPAIALPTDRPRGQVRVRVGGQHLVEVDPGDLAEIRNASAAGGLTVYTWLLGAMHVLIVRRTHRRDIVISTQIGRRTASNRHVIGLLSNMVLLRTRIGERATLRTAFAEVRETVLQAAAHQDYPFLRVREMLRLQDIAEPTHLGVSLLQAPPTAAIAQLGEFPPFPEDDGVARHELAVRGFETDGRLALLFEYDRALFDAPTIEALAAELVATMIEAARHSEHSVASASEVACSSERSVA
jgi:acyl-CoA synthetase (AMP-forming)/AMP-acid ligase II/acyl carrier protein